MSHKFSITLYKMKCKTNKVDKTDYLDFMRNYNKYLILENTDITNMSILIPYDDSKEDNEVLRYCNYCYVDKVNRYYFINNKIMRTGNLLELVLEEDYLMSWKSKILSSNQIIARNEFEYDGRIPDSDYPTLNEKMVTAKIIGGSPFSTANMASGKNCIVMTVAGGV